MTAHPVGSTPVGSALVADLRSRRALVAVALCALSLAHCTCEPPEDTKPLPAVGAVRAEIVDGAVELSLSTQDARVRTLQVKVALTDAKATDTTAVGDIDLVEDGLDPASDEPASTLVVVVADTRRVLLPEGTFARIAVDGAPTQVKLSGAIAVDEDGKKRTLTVVVP